MRETILEILSGVRSDIDFENNTKLIVDSVKNIIINGKQ